MIKITSGYLKNKSFHAPDGLSTRPTSSKVREALFNILGAKTEDSTWLDLFAGSGSIGFEAISRYAKEVTFIENEKNAFFNLKKNIELLDLKNKSKLLKTDSIQYISKTNDSYDFIFIDPPYNSNLYEKAFEILNKKNNILNDNGVLIIEHHKKYNLPNLFLEKTKTYNYGETSLTLFNKFKIVVSD